MVEELDQYLIIQSIDDGYRSVIRSTLNEWQKGDDNVLFVCFDDSTEGFIAAKRTDGMIYSHQMWASTSRPCMCQNHTEAKDMVVNLWNVLKTGQAMRLVLIRITLAVESNNVPAQEFWEDKGYQTTLKKREKSVN